MTSKILSAIPESVSSLGFRKAFFYSLISFLLGWAIVYLKEPEIQELYLRYGILIPLVNDILVLIKQYIDSLLEGKEGKVSK